MFIEPEDPQRRADRWQNAVIVVDPTCNDVYSITHIYADDEEVGEVVILGSDFLEERLEPSQPRRVFFVEGYIEYFECPTLEYGREYDIEFEGDVHEVEDHDEYMWQIIEEETGYSGPQTAHDLAEWYLEQ